MVDKILLTDENSNWSNTLSEHADQRENVSGTNTTKLIPRDR